MKKHHMKKFMILLSVIALSSFVSNNATGGATSKHAGEALYNKHCIACHPEADKLKPTRNMIEEIRNPISSMPAFGEDKISDDNVKKIDAYIQQEFYRVADISTVEQLRIALMQDQSGAAEKFMPLLEYLSKKGINATFVPTQDYPAAAGMFAVGAVDAMFSGSGVAGFMIMKDLAKPAVRPVDKKGYSTYWAVVIAKKGSPKYTGSAKYFSGKRVALTSLASSGDFYFHSLSGVAEVNATELNVASHGAAIELLNKGLADVAIVKNRVWDALKDKYPDLMMVGEDKGENPDNTLIMSKNVPLVLAAKISGALLGLKDDTSIEAVAVKESLGIQGFIKTTPKDFEQTLSLLKKADATKKFDVKL